MTAIVEETPTEMAERAAATRSGFSNALLLIYADAVDDFERTRIATGNRIQALRHVKRLAGSPEEARLDATQKSLQALEDSIVKDLEQAVKDHPLGPWVQRTPGLGYKQAGRLLAAIGDPYWHGAEDRPRLVSELWSYCGFSVTEGRAVFRQKGVRSRWSTTAKMRTYNVAAQVIRYTGEPYTRTDGRTVTTARSPYRDVYDARREITVARVHTTQCQNRSRYSPNGCGTKDHPEWGAPGTAWRDGHCHADALRIVGKEILRDLWTEAKELKLA